MYWSARTGGSWLASAGASSGAARGQRLKPEGLVRGEEQGRVLQMHVGAGGPSLAVTALEVHDLLRYSSRDSGGEAALAGRNAGEVRGVTPAMGGHAADRVPYHLGRHGGGGGVVRGARAQDETREDGRAGVALDASPGCAKRVCADAEDAEPHTKLVYKI